jgi:hypothetical protein
MDHPLAILAFLNNEDKHRILNTTPAAIRAIGYDVEPVRDIASFDMHGSKVTWDPLVDGAELIRVPVVSSGPNPEMKLKRGMERVEINIRHRARTSTSGYIETEKEIFEALGLVLDEVQKLLDLFVTEFR